MFFSYSGFLIDNLKEHRCAFYVMGHHIILVYLMCNPLQSSRHFCLVFHNNINQAFVVSDYMNDPTVRILVKPFYSSEHC